MSLPVFLNTSIYNNMPDGNKNEWGNFYGDNGYELEANAFFPLFWLLLFSKVDIKKAQYIDDYDIVDEDSYIERQECFEDFGETTYPYFVIGKEEALKNLKNRKEGFLKIFGLDFESYYSDFQSIIQNKYDAKYILLRTNGLDLGEQSEQQFITEVATYENLDNAKIASEQDIRYWNFQKKEINQHKDLSYYLQGTNFPKNESTYVENPNYIAPQKVQDISETAIWIIAIIVGISTVIVWFLSKSVLYSVINFAVTAIGISYIANKIKNWNH